MTRDEARRLIAQSGNPERAAALLHHDLERENFFEGEALSRRRAVRKFFWRMYKNYS